MKKAELLKCLQESLRKGELKDSLLITKVECASEESLANWDDTLTKMHGGAGRFPHLDAERAAKRATERKAYEDKRNEVPGHLHDHYDALRSGTGEGLSYGDPMSHDAAKRVIDIASTGSENIAMAADHLMNHRHTASSARKFLGKLQERHKTVGGVK